MSTDYFMESVLKKKQQQKNPQQKLFNSSDDTRSVVDDNVTGKWKSVCLLSLI